MDNDSYATGAYRGVPYRVNYTEQYAFDWDLVNPREGDPGAAFLLFRNNREDDSLLKKLPEKYVDDCRDGLVELCLKHIDKIAPQLEQLAKNGADIFAADRYDEDDLADDVVRREMAEELIYSMCQSDSLDIVTDIMGACGISFRDGTISDYNNSYQYLYFRTDGQKIAGKCEENFNNAYDEIQSWLEGNCFAIEIPGTTFDGNIAKTPFSSHESEHPFSGVIKEHIDHLLAPRKGKYKIIASRASYDENQETLKYSSEENIDIFVSDRDSARQIANFYRGHATIQENESPGQTR